MKTQREWLQEVTDLVESNSEMEIHFCVDSEKALEFGWTAHIISKVEISPWFCDDGRIFVDEDQIKNHLEDLHFWNSNLTLEEIKKEVNKLYELKIKKAICVYTDAG